jgi:DNA-directed RNA polymerase specialized sigma24 family protein
MSRGPDYFATTRWTLVVSAARPSSPLADQALEELCRIYWYPLYLFVRHQGFGREDAEDRVQSFLERLLRGRDLENLSAGQGRFRAFLLASMKHFLANDWRDARRQKRGGGHEPLPLDWNGADDRFQRDLVDAAPSVEAAFDRAWAIAILEQVIKRLEAECRANGKGPFFEVARSFLAVDRESVPYAEAARQLGMDEASLRVAVHRLRKRYRTLLQDEIAQTLCDPAGVDEELRSLRLALTR